MRKSKKTGLKGSKTFAFVVDGDTEVWYLQMLKRNERELNINIEPKLPSKKSITEQYKMASELAEFYTKVFWVCLLYTSPSPRDQRGSRMPSSA